jgi:hypothetical protein
MFESLVLDFQNEPAGLQSGEVKSTSLSVVTVLAWPVFSPVRVTVAPGITLLALSVTAPDIEPVIVCPLTTMLKAKTASNTNKISSL